jgi:hypothetical protein
MVRFSPPKLFSQKVDKYFLWKEEFATKCFHFILFFVAKDQCFLEMNFDIVEPNVFGKFGI